MTALRFDLCLVGIGVLSIGIFALAHAAGAATGGTTAYLVIGIADILGVAVIRLWPRRH